MKTHPENSCKEKTAFEQIYTTYFERMVLFAIKILGSNLYAEDVVQEVFTGIYQQNPHFISQEALVNYIFRSVYNKGIDLLRRKELTLKFEEAYLEKHTTRLATETSPVLYNELSTIVEKKINKLPHMCKKIFIMKLYAEKTNPEISRTLKLSVKTVENQVFIARNVLRNYLNAYICS